MSEREQTAAEFFLRALENYGVRRMFGNPGTTELPIMRHLDQSTIDYELALHEDIAVGMAGGYASSLRYDEDPEVLPLGVVNLHATGGLVHGLGNLYGAHRSNVPLLVTAGAQSTDYRHKEPILTGDMVNIAGEFTRWSEEVLDPQALPHLVRRAVRTALNPPAGPVFLSLPLNVMDQPLEGDPLPLGDRPDPGSAPGEKIDALRDHLQSARSPIVVVGDTLGQYGKPAVDSLVELAETTGAMIFGEILAAECSFPTDHEQWMSFLPPDADLVSELLDTDLVILVGCSSNTPLFRDGNPLIPPATTCVHIHTDSYEIGKNERVDLALQGHPARVIQALNGKLEGQIDETTRRQRLETAREIDALIDTRFQDYVSNEPEENRCSKPEVVDVLRQELGDCFLVDEGVTGRYALLNDWPMQAESYLSNKGGALGYGLPASVGVALGLRDRNRNRRVVAYVGDGSFWYYPQSLYGAFLKNLPVTFLILNNRGYSILKEKLEEFYNHTARTPGLDLDENLSPPLTAESQGLRASSVSSRNGLQEALQTEATASGPGLIEVLVHD